MMMLLNSDPRGVDRLRFIKRGILMYIQSVQYLIKLLYKIPTKQSGLKNTFGTLHSIAHCIKTIELRV
jgi:hypothetical protein